MNILFELHHMYYLPQFLPIMDVLKQQYTHKVFVSINLGESEDEVALFQKECDRLKLNPILARSETDRKQSIKAMDFDVIFVGNKQYLNEIATSNTCVVMVYHGIGLKNSYYTDISPRIDVIAVESTKRLPELANHRALPVVCGFTKLDPLFTGIKIEEDENELPTVLYAPTFYPSSIERTLPVLGQLEMEINLIVKLHQFSWTKKKYHYHYELAQQSCTSNQHMQLLPFSKYNIVPFFNKATILISDISSTLFEFLAVNRPVIQTNYFTYRFKHRLFPTVYKHRFDQDRFDQIDFTHRIDYPDELNNAILSALNKNDELGDKRKIARDTYLHNCDGKASERLLNGLFEYLKK